MSNLLLSYYLKLTGSRRRTFKLQVMKATGWSNSTFYYKCQNGNLTKLEQIAIKAVIAPFKNEDRAQQRFIEKYYIQQHRQA